MVGTHPLFISRPRGRSKSLGERSGEGIGGCDGSTLTQCGWTAARLDALTYPPQLNISMTTYDAMAIPASDGNE